MKSTQKKIIVLFLFSSFLASTSYFLGNNSVINSKPISEDENSDDQSNNLNDVLKTSALNQLVTSGSSIGVIGYTEGTKAGSITDALWVYGGGGIYHTKNSPYTIPFPVSTGGTSVVPSWTFKSSSLSVSNLLEQNNFYWNKNFNAGNWTPSSSLAGTYGTAAYADLTENTNGYVKFNNYQTSYVITPISDGWALGSVQSGSPNRANSYSQTASDNYPSTYTYYGTDLTDQSGNGFYQASSVGSRTADSTGLTSNANIYSGYHVVRTDSHDHNADNYAIAGVRIYDTYTYTTTAEDYVAYTYDGTVPEDVDFTCNVESLSLTRGQLASFSYIQTVSFTIKLLSPSRAREVTLYDNTFSATTFNSNPQYLNFQSFFTESGSYILQTKIESAFRIERAYAQVTGDGGSGCTFDYSSTGNSAAAYLISNTRADSFQFNFAEEKPYPTGYCYLQSTINFNGRYVQSTPAPTLEFDYVIDSSLVQNENTFVNGKIRATTTYHYSGGGSSNEHTDYNINSGGGSSHATIYLTLPLLNASQTVDVQLGVYISSGFEVAYTADTTNARITFTNVEMNVKTIPKPTDVALRIAWEEGGSARGAKYFSSGVNGAGSLDISDAFGADPWDAGDTFNFFYTCTSQQLTFNYEHKLVATFTVDGSTLTSIVTAVNGSTTVKYDVAFDWNVPNNKALLKTNYDYSDSFEFNVTFPRWVQDGEPYWDLSQATVKSGGYSETAGGTETSPWTVETQIRVWENTNYNDGSTTYTNTQIAELDNDLFDEYLSVNQFNQKWSFNFTAPNLVNKLVIDNNQDFSSPDTQLMSGNYSNVRVDYTSSISASEGRVGTKWVSSVEAQRYARAKDVAGGTSDSFTQGGSNAWLTALPLGTYYAVSNYTVDKSDYSSVPATWSGSGIMRLGYSYKGFNLVVDTYIQTLQVTPQIYDTRTHGLTNQLINISIRWREKGTNLPITSGDVKISIAQFQVGAGEIKQSVIPSEWYQKSMIDKGNGLYSIFVNPTFYSHTGNMSWGYHNYTITAIKTNYLGQEKTGDFNIIIDTVLKVIDPDKGSKDPASNHPHFKYGIMGGNDTGTPSDYMTVFSVYVYENLSSPLYITNNPGNPYREMVEVKYTCINYTKGDLYWWNWSWNAKEFSTDNTGNPINGSFTSSGAEWTATLYYPTKNCAEFKDINNYKAGIVLEYNVTVRVLRNMTYPAIGQPYYFQPNMVVNQSLEDGYAVGRGLGDTYRDETILIKLIKPEEGNFTRVVLINNKAKDGTIFDMGIYNNKSTQQPYPYEEPVYLGRQYHYNLTVGPHGKIDDMFRFRLLFNGTYQLKEQARIVTAPPCGPLNSTNTNIVLQGWDPLNPVSFSADTSYLWNCRVLDNATKTMKTYWGCTYYSTWLNLSSKPAGIYELFIIASKYDYKDSIVRITLEILEQKTDLVWNKTVVSAAGQSPITIVAKVPYGNTTSLEFTYSDITNQALIGKQPISKATIICIADTLLTDNNPFVNNWTAKGSRSTWRYVDKNNGNYSLFIDYTAYETILEQPALAQLTYQIHSENYTARIFTIQLNITRRHIAIQLISYDNVSYYTENVDYHMHKFLTFGYRVLDLDNNSFIIGLSSTAVLQSFAFKYWNATLTDKDINYVLSNPNDPAKYYNISYDIKTINAGAYNMRLTIDRPAISTYIYYLATYVSTFRIDPAPIQVNLDLTESKNVTEYIPTTVSRVTQQLINFQPYFKITLIDSVYSTQSGYILFSGMSIGTNYSNPWYNDFHGVQTNVANDLWVDSTTDAPNLIIYIDAMRMNARTQLYSLNLTFSKKNYITTNYKVSFNIDNATTIFQGDQICFGSRDSPISSADRVLFPISAAIENRGFSKIIPWGKWVGIRFIYFANNTVTYVGQNLPEIGIGGIHYSIDDFVSSKPWSDFATVNAIFNDLGSGGYHYLQFQLNTTYSGSVNIVFNLTIYATNFKAVSFPVNITINDRNTHADTDLQDHTLQSKDDPEWTERAYIDIRYIDDDHDSNKYIQEALINGTGTGYGGTIDFGDGETANWTVTEYILGQYKVEVETENLVVNKNYTIYLNVTKLHYESNIVVFKFVVSPVSIRIEVEVSPSEEYESDEVDELKILVSIFVLLKSEGGTVEVNKGITLPGLKVTYILQRGEDVIYEGELEWDDAEQKFVVVIPTEDEDGNKLTGIYELVIRVETNNPNIRDGETTVKLLGIGSEVGPLPWWFIYAVFGLIAAAGIMAGYVIRKAIYFRIPFVLRKIDETVKKIEKDKYPPIGVMTGRDEFIINSVINFLEECNIEWESKEKFEIKKVGEVAKKERLPPYKIEEIQEELNKIQGLSAEEKVLFVDELKRLDREAQDEFLASLKGQSQTKE